jgi:steroid 5-alpha reductase family enzyme
MSELAMPLMYGALATSVVMCLAWLWQQTGGKAGVVDVAWTFSVGLLAIAYVTWWSDGLLSRRILLGVLAGLWSLRLGLHLLPRLFHDKEDERYQRMKAGWGRWAPLRIFLFYQSQAVAAALFALPMLAGGNSRVELNGWDALGVALWCVAIFGEWQADRQLAQFRNSSEKRKGVCQVGWWRYSRHPNYFFEWLHWCSYVPLAAFAPWGWLSLLAPAAMYYFLNFVTGIPPAEEQAIGSRGDVYREYQNTTSPFFPWPPRNWRHPS